MARTVVILGASYAAIPIIHYLLKHTATKTKDLKVIIVAPNTHLFWNFASVRGILPNLLSEDKILLPIAPTLAKYPSDQYELVHGIAEKVDPDKNLVEVRGNDGSARIIQYDELVIATGSSFKNNMPFKNLSSTEETRAALREWAKRIEAAKSIVVAGAGATGVEIAGELGQEYAVSGAKQITLVCSDELPLAEPLRRDVRESAKSELERLKVKVITNARVATASSAAAAETSTLTLTLTKTSASSADEAPITLHADLLIPTYGTTPNTAFLPPSLLDGRGYVRQTARLRAEGYDNIFVVGDVGSLETHQAVHADSQAVYAARSLEARILGGEPGSSPPSPEEEEAYKPIDKVMMGVTIGRNRGTGQVGGWKLWSIVVWFIKGRYLGTDYAPEYARGERTLSVKSW
ncbi:hypothetical protein VTH06DRAFT_6336 [Thermothelomyces fergusii]